MSDHAKLSPSGSKTWLICPASVEAQASVVEPDNEHSMKGTAAHWVRAEWLTKGEPPEIGTKAPNDIDVTEEMINLVAHGVGWTKNYLASAGGPVMLLVEEKVQIGEFFGLEPSLLWGTADTLIGGPHELVVYDLKAGYVDVTVEDNPQLNLYALGAMEELGWLWPQVRFVIDQPKNGGLKEHVVSREELLERGEKLKPKVHAATQPNAPFIPTAEGCRWCKARGICKAQQQEALALARREFSDPVAVVNNISLDDLGLLLTKAEMVELAIDAAREHAKKLLQCGTVVPGWKLVEGRQGNRAWRPGTEGEVVQLLGPAAYDRKLITPAAAEKIAGKGSIDHLTARPPPSVQLAPATDKRPALAAHFEVLDVADLLD